MNAKVAHEVCLNLRDPLDARKRVHLTARSIRLITILFLNKNMDVITLHSILLRMAYTRGCFQSKKYITMSDIVVYVLAEGIITMEEVEEASKYFDIEKDSKHDEVNIMKKIMTSLWR